MLSALYHATHDSAASFSAWSADSLRSRGRRLAHRTATRHGSSRRRVLHGAASAPPLPGNHFLLLFVPLPKHQTNLRGQVWRLDHDVLSSLRGNTAQRLSSHLAQASRLCTLSPPPRLRGLSRSSDVVTPGCPAPPSLCCKTIVTNSHCAPGRPDGARTTARSGTSRMLGRCSRNRLSAAIILRCGKHDY